jgi:tRNA threonylcarbamoyladenosine biosynthesis protein TsaE
MTGAQTITRALPIEAATIELGAALARVITPGLVVHLVGELGAGKTTLARALIQTLAPGTRVKSPTYTLIESYPLADFELHHLDLYRIVDPGEIEFLGLRDRAPGSVLLVEWPDRGAGELPPADLVIALRTIAAGREATISARSPAGETALENLPEH